MCSRLAVSFTAKEDILPPLGIPPDHHREIGFATVVLNLENHQQTHQWLVLQAIEILSEPDQQLQPFLFQPRTIELKPLEHAVIDIHLANQTGYLTTNPVKAVVHYQLGQQTPATIVSELVPIERS